MPEAERQASPAARSGSTATSAPRRKKRSAPSSARSKRNPAASGLRKPSKELVADQGIEAKPKEVYNGGVIRRGQLRQVAYGRYVVREYSGNVVTTEFDEDPLRSHDE